MRAFIFVVLVAWLPLSLCAQKFQLPGTMPGIPHEFGSLIKLNNSNYIIAYPYANGFRIDTLNSSGTFLSGKNYQCTTSNSNFKFFNCKRAPDGSIYVVGSCDKMPNDGDHDAVLYKIDPTGIIAWSSKLGSTLGIEEAFHDIYISPSGSVYAVGIYTPDYYTQTVAKFSPTGQLLFAESFSIGTLYDQTDRDFCRIIAPNDTDLYIVGSANSTYWTSVYLTRFDTLGNHLSTKISSGSFIYAADAVANDTSIYITGALQQGSTYQVDDIFLMNISFEGRANWLKRYSSPYDDEGQRCFIKSDGNIVIGGKTRAMNTAHDAMFVIQTNKDGEQLMAKYHPMGSRDGNVMAIESTDSTGGFAVLGYQEASSSGYLYFEANNAGGWSGCNEQLFQFEEETSFPEMYPSMESTITLSTSNTLPLIIITSSPPFSGYACNNNCLVNSSINSFASSFCVNDSIFASAVDTTLTYYYWFIDSTLLDSGETFHHLLNDTGAHSLKLVAGNGPCSDSMIIYFNVKSPVIPQFSLLRHYHLLSLTNTSPNSMHSSWWLSDGATSYNDFFKHNFKDTGSVYVKLISSNACGSDSTGSWVRVNDSTGCNFNNAYYTPSGSISASSIVATCDGGMAAAGSCGLGGFGVSKVSLTGELLWSIQSGSTYPINRIIETYDLGLLTTSNPTFSGGAFIVTKFDSLGHTLWAYRFGGSGSRANDIAELPNHDIVVTGYLNSGNGFLLCMTEYGEFKWFKRLYAIEYGNRVLVKDNRIYVLGELTTNVAIAQFDFSGVQLWSKVYGGNFVVDKAKDGILLGSAIVAYCQTSYSGFGSDDLWLLCIDTLGNIIWSKVYGTQASETPNSITMAGDKIVITQFPISNGPSMIYVLDSIGTIVGGYSYDWNFIPSTTRQITSNYEGQLITLAKNAGGFDFFISKANFDTSYVCYATGNGLPDATFIPPISNGSMITTDEAPGIRAVGGGSPILVIDSVACYSDNCSSNAGFSYSFSGASINFTNTSTGPITTVLWDFGDGQFSTQSSPSHVYWFAGQYTVCLHTYTPCGSDSTCQVVNVTITSTGEQAVANAFTAWPNPASNIISISSVSESDRFLITDVYGKVLIEQSFELPNAATADVSGFAAGVYFILVYDRQGIVSSQKITITQD